MLKKVVYLLLLISIPAMAQKEGANWYFGENAGLNFNSGMPVAVTDGQLIQTEGCASISDFQGNLLFYTNGVQIFNANHQLMVNGDGLLGNDSSTQSAIIIRQPGSSTRYYVFAVASQGGGAGLTYSVVDMSLEGGLGGVLEAEKNLPLISPVAEKVTAVYHGNQQDIWVVTHILGTDEFMAYLVTSSGIDPPVITGVGDTHLIDMGSGALGYLKASPDGTLLASGKLGFTSKGLEVFDFDTNTGIISNARKLNNYNTYGIEFSPNSEILYCTSSGAAGGQILQYDLSIPTLENIQASETEITLSYSYSALQLGIDGKIYAAQYGITSLGVINNPDELGTSCNFIDDAVDLLDKVCQYGLPQFIQSYFQFEIGYEGVCSGQETQFEIISHSVIASAEWDFGDGDTSEELLPAHTYNEPGEYTVTVNIVTDLGYEISLSETVTIVQGAIANDAEDMETCDDNSNDGFSAFTLSEQTEAILGDQSPDDYTVAYYSTEELAIAGEGPLAADSYTNTENPQTIYARVTNNETGCYDITTFDLIVQPIPDISNPDALIACEDQQGEGTALFDLTVAISQITSDDDELEVVFYETEEDIEDDVPIDDPSDYTNTTAESQTIYFTVAHTDASNCKAMGTLALTVNPLPNLNNNISDYILCDVNNPGDGTETFDLTTKYSEVTNEPGLTLTYSFEQAGDLVTIADPASFENTVPGGQTIFVTTENEFGCTNTTSFDIVGAPLPDIEEPEPFFACEEEPGLGLFNLENITSEIADGANLVISYYTTEEQADEAIEDSLSSPYLSPTATIFARVEVAATGCTVIVPVQLEVIPSPVADAHDPLEECDLNGDGVATFNLDPVLEQIAAEMGNVNVTIYETVDDAIYEGYPIPDTGSYNNIAVDPDTTGIQTLYIRVEANTTDANGCFDVVPLDLIIYQIPEATEPSEPLEMCDNGADDTDGEAIFNLTVLNDEILGDLNPVQHTITCHRSSNGAWNDTDEIQTPASYASESDTVWARITDNDTGCYDVVEINLIVNPLPEAAEPTPLTLCDEDPGDPEQEVFDLTVKIPEIIGTQEGLDVTFHFEYDEAVANVNAVTDPYNYVNEPTVETLFVRVTNAETGCYRIVLMDVRVAPLPVVQMPTVDDLTTCDTDGNGIAEFDLQALIDDMINNAPEPLVITFHETPENAQAGIDPIPNPASYYNNVPYEQDIWVRVVNTDTGCYNTGDIVLHLTVVPAPQAPALEDITLCDDQDDNGQDGLAFVDLTVQDAVIEEALGVAPGELTIHYFTDEDYANEGAPRITVPDHFYAANEQWIWVRVEDPVSECYSISSFQVLLNEPLLLETPSPLTVCNSELPNDAQETFDLTTKDDEILGELGIGQGFTVEYFESQADVDANTPIANPQAYTNPDDENPKTLYVVVTTDEGCRSYTTLTIRVLPLPQPDTIPDALVMCDDNGDGDGFEEFDLTEAEDDIRDNDFSAVITYHTSLEDAEQGINPIATPEAYVSDNATIWVRMEANTTNDDDPACYQVVELQLQVTPLPGIGDNPVYAICEQNTDFEGVFYLKDFIENILGEGADENYDITFYLDQDAMDAGTAMPVIYENESNPQTILVHVEDLITGCEITSPMTLIVEEAAVANPVTENPMLECDVDGLNNGFFEFDLTMVEEDVLGAQDPDEYTVTYYLTEEEAIAAENPIETPEAFTNTVVGQTIWVNVMHTGSISQCSDVTSFDIVVELLPEPIISTDNNILCIDYITQNVIRPVILNSNITPNGHSYDWYLNGVLVATTTDTQFYEAEEPGLYTVIVTSANNCVSEVSAEFEVIQSGPASPVGTGYYVTEAFSDEQTITVLVEGYGEYEYRLDEDGMWQSSNVFVDVAPGSHTVYVRDITGGEDMGCGELPLTGVSVIDYPRFFTPNGDGFHDTWNIVGLDGTGSVIYIFDRYGKLMKQVSPDDESTGWDGTFNGQPVPATDYWFTVTYPEYVGDAVMMKEFKAHFSLKR